MARIYATRISHRSWHATTIVLATEREPEGQAKRSKAADAVFCFRQKNIRDISFDGCSLISHQPSGADRARPVPTIAHSVEHYVVDGAGF